MTPQEIEILKNIVSHVVPGDNLESLETTQKALKDLATFVNGILPIVNARTVISKHTSYDSK